MSDIKVTSQHDGTGGIITYTGPDKESVLAAATFGKQAIDYMRSPSIYRQPMQMKDGTWQAQVRYFGLD